MSSRFGKEPCCIARRRTLAFGLATGIFAGLGSAANTQAQPAGSGHATREVQSFQQLEEALLQAIRDKDVARIDGLLDGDFEMVEAQDPSSPVPREDWIDSVRKPGSGAWRVEHLSVRDFGTFAITSFQLKPSPARSGASPVFVVDTWQRTDSRWRLLSRYAAPVLGSRRLIPGDAPPTTIPKQF